MKFSLSNRHISLIIKFNIVCCNINCLTITFIVCITDIRYTFANWCKRTIKTKIERIRQACRTNKWHICCHSIDEINVSKSCCLRPIDWVGILIGHLIESRRLTRQLTSLKISTRSHVSKIGNRHVSCCRS